MSCAIELEIGAGSSPGEFLTRVVDAPSGSGASAVFQLDVDDLLRERDALENTVLARSDARYRYSVARRTPRYFAMSLPVWP